MTHFLDRLERENVEAARVRTGRFAVELEVEPHKGPGTLAGPPSDRPAQNRAPLWEASAGAGNARGAFDAAYSYGNSQGDEGHLLGTAPEVGAELARVLLEPIRDDVQAMKCGTDRLFVLCGDPHKRNYAPWRIMRSLLDSRRYQLHFRLRIWLGRLLWSA
jgi:hypothetical protein